MNDETLPGRDARNVDGPGSDAIACASESQLHSRVIAGLAGDESPAEHLRNALQVLAPIVADYGDKAGDPAALWSVEDVGADIEAAVTRIRKALDVLEGTRPRPIAQLAALADWLYALDDRGHVWRLDQPYRASIKDSSTAWKPLPALPPRHVRPLGAVIPTDELEPEGTDVLEHYLGRDRVEGSEP